MADPHDPRLGDVFLWKGYSVPDEVVYVDRDSIVLKDPSGRSYAHDRVYFARNASPVPRSLITEPVKLYRSGGTWAQSWRGNPALTTITIHPDHTWTED
jgi:hypothetical protein